MKINKIALATSIVLSLSGCSDESDPKVEKKTDENAETITPEIDTNTGRNIDELEILTPTVRPIIDTLTPEVEVQRPLDDLETLTPTIRPIVDTLTPQVDVLRPIHDLETLTPTVRPIPEGITPTVKLNFDIPSSYIIDVAYIERDYTEPFTLDDVSVSYNAVDDNYTIVNGTARYIDKPTLRIDGMLYRLDTLLEPFQHQTFLFRTHKDEAATAVEYVEEQPFFRSLMNGYKDRPTNEYYSLPSAEQAWRFEQEIRGHKNAANDFGFTVHFADYISSYGTTRAAKALSFDTTDCPYDHEHEHPMVRSGNDSSDPNMKILSYLNHEPRAEHYILHQPGYAGMATVGSGWLSVVDYRLYREGQVRPHSTYFRKGTQSRIFSRRRNDIRPT